MVDSSPPAMTEGFWFLIYLNSFKLTREKQSDVEEIYWQIKPNSQDFQNYTTNDSMFLFF